MFIVRIRTSCEKGGTVQDQGINSKSFLGDPRPCHRMLHSRGVCVDVQGVGGGGCMQYFCKSNNLWGTVVNGTAKRFGLSLHPPSPVLN